MPLRLVVSAHATERVRGASPDVAAVMGSESRWETLTARRANPHVNRAPSRTSSRWPTKSQISAGPILASAKTFIGYSPACCMQIRLGLALDGERSWAHQDCLGAPTLGPLGFLSLLEAQ